MAVRRWNSSRWIIHHVPSVVRGQLRVVARVERRVVAVVRRRSGVTGLVSGEILIRSDTVLRVVWWIPRPNEVQILVFISG